MKPITQQDALFLSRLEGKDKFTPEELASLLKGEATFSLYGRAERLLRGQRAYENAPLTRVEANQNFLRLETFQHFIKNDFAGRINYLLSAVQVMIDKGLISDVEIQLKGHIREAEGWTHLCKHCMGAGEPACCSGTLTFAYDIFPDLPDELAEKVVKCDGFRREEQPVAAANTIG